MRDLCVLPLKTSFHPFWCTSILLRAMHDIQTSCGAGSLFLEVLFLWLGFVTNTEFVRKLSNRWRMWLGPTTSEDSKQITRRFNPVLSSISLMCEASSAAISLRTPRCTHLIPARHSFENMNVGIRYMKASIEPRRGSMPTSRSGAKIQRRTDCTLAQKYAFNKYSSSSGQWK